MPARPDPAVVHANTVAAGPQRYTEGYFGRGAARLHYVSVGKGPLIIFHHGFPSFWYSGFDQMEALKSRYRVVAVDGLGAGLSAKPVAAAAYRIDRLAARLDALSRHLGGNARFTLIGHDWGAALAFAYAQGYPRRLDAVIGISAPPYNLFLDLVRDSPAQQARSQYMQVFRRLTLQQLQASDTPERIWRQSYAGLLASGDLSPAEGDLFRQVLRDPRAMNGGMNWYRANIPAFDAIGMANHWPRNNPRITVPTLLVWGDADKTFADEMLTRITDYATDLAIARLPGINHWATMENPGLATAAIIAFLDKQRTTRHGNLAPGELRNAAAATAQPQCRASTAAGACDIRR